ncbi:MAG: phosphomannomutase/phosphoglucomutase [Patescibacteria group bacterium]|jgi:phosphomannomutase
MKIDPNIFKSYDVRGVYPETINEEIMHNFGIAFANKYSAKKVAVGYDGRVSTPALKDALFGGLIEAGADVVDLGISTTDMTYVASAYYDDLDGAIMITASHNPSQYNGLKAVKKGAVALSGNDGLFEIRDMIVNDQLETSDAKGKIEKRDIYKVYGDKLISLIDKSALKPLRVVVDAGNGVAGYVIDKIFGDLPIEIIPLYFEIDGTFPNHQPSPIEDKNVVDLKKKVLEEKADLGLAFDGDGDRVYFIDEKGQTITASVILAMVTKSLLEKNPGARILYNVVTSWCVRETIVKYGGVPSITLVGHSLIKTQMRKEDGFFAGEHSGHYFYKNLYYADSGMLTALIVLEMVSVLNQPISELAAEFSIYSDSGEINTEVADPKAKIEEIKAKYADGKQFTLDGLSVEYSDWWFSLRSSNTEPLLRLNVEAKSEELMETKRDELLSIIRN